MKAVHMVGGLGSQMLAYSLYLALEKAYPNENVICDFTAMHKYNHICHNGEELTQVFGIRSQYIPSQLAQIAYSKNPFFRLMRKLSKITGLIKFHDALLEKYNYDKSIFFQKGTVIYHQCWTSWKYFVGVEKKIKRVFKFKPIKDIRNLEVQKKILSTKSVSVHVRRGDYVGSKFSEGLVNNLEYYRRAIEIINQKINKPHFFLFSDDPQWVTENLVKEFKDAPITQIYWNKKNHSYLDMQLMASCEHHIIPNSSFSWMAAYLANSDDQIVIAPKYWSGDYSRGIELKDMNLPNWIVLEN